MNIICLEGCSGTGKTTQFNLLRDYYSRSNLKLAFVVEKQYEPFKTIVKEWYAQKGPNTKFTEKEIYRFAEARVLTYLNNFSIYENNIDAIVLDRYFYTSAVYQANNKFSLQEILDINIKMGAPIPTATFLFDCDPIICFRRATERNKRTGENHVFSTSPQKISSLRKKYHILANSRKEAIIVETKRSIFDINKLLTTKIKSILK